MTKPEIFDDVVSIMQNDSSTCKDKQGGDLSYFRAQIADDMDDEKFLFVMRSYLATFGLTGHLVFYRTEGRGSMSFEVRRYQDVLYVDDVAENSLLRVGDRIVEVEGIPVKEFAEAHAEFLYGETEERQAPHWAPLLSFFREVTVEGRPTMGILDYSNLNMITYGPYGFAYPTSRRTELDKGIHMMDRGVPVQVHVPWTPEHLTRDVDLEKVFELIDDL